MSTDCVHSGAGSPRQAVSLPIQDHGGELLAVADVTLLSCCFGSLGYDKEGGEHDTVCLPHILGTACRLVAACGHCCCLAQWLVPKGAADLGDGALS